jgi:hypothetical protein
MEPVRLEIMLDDKTLTGMRSVEGNMDGLSKYIEVAIARLEAELKALNGQITKESGKTGIVSDKDLADVQALTGVINKLKEQLEQYEKQKKQTSSTPLVADDPAPKLNNVKMSLQQIARELPALAMGPQIFFLAISNNIPMFTDAVASARKEYERLIAAGQKATPVWKQLLSSLFSWQTAMAAAITITVVYGKEIGEWAKGLFKAKDATLDLLSAEQEMALARKNAAKDAKDEQVQLDILYNKLKNTAISAKERTAAANEWLKKYPQYANVLDGENVNLGKLESAYKSLSKEIYANAVARSYADKIADISIKKDQELIKAQNQYVSYLNAQKTLDKAIANLRKSQGKDYDVTNNEAIRNQMKFVEEQKQLWLDLRANVKQYDENIEAISNHINTLDLFPQPEEETYDYWKQQQERAESVLKKIKSDVKKTLDEAAKEGKDLFSLGVDKDIVKNYQDAVKQLKESQEALKVYDTKDHKTSGKTTLDYQNELADARIRAQKKLEETLIAIMRDGREKRMAQASKEYKDSIAEIDKEERDQLARIEKARKAGTKVSPAEDQAVKSTAEQSRLAAYQLYIKEYTEIQNEFLTNSAKAWNEYNKLFGTSQQKRLAIAQEYAMKIAEEQDPNKKKILEKQMGQALSEFDFQNLKKEINWEMVFGNLEAVTRKQLQGVKKQLIAFKNSPEFRKSASPETIKVVEEALNNINTALVDKDGFFGGLGEALSDYESKVRKVAEAQEELNKALQSGDESAIEAAREKKNKAESEMIGSKSVVENATNRTISNLTLLGNAIRQLGSTSEMSLSTLGGIVGDLADVFTESGQKIGGLIGAIFAILDSIGEVGIDKFVGNIFSSIGSMVSGIMSADWNPWSWIGADKLFKGADYSDYNDMVEEYGKLNEIWSELIDKKREYIDMSYGAEADKAGREAEELLNKSIESYRILGRERLNSGASMWSSSIGKRQRKRMGTTEWNEARAALGSAFDEFQIGEGRMTGLFDLSVEQLEKLKGEAPTFWAKLDDDVRDYLNSIIEGSEKLEDIQQQVKEQLTQVSFDSIRNNFLDTLMDMSSDAEDFADNFEQYMQRKILTDMVADKFAGQLENWYESFVEYSRGGDINEDAYKDLQNRWNKIVEDALKERDDLKALFGWSSDESYNQTGRAGMVTSITEETAGKLEGIGNAMLDHVISIDNSLSDNLEMMADSIAIMAENSYYLRHLSDISDNISEMKNRGVKLKE